MSSLAVRLRCRPVRIGWCVQRGDFDAFRQAARRSFSLWGGRYNPIIPIDNKEEARRLIDLFRVDCLYQATNTNTVKDFINNQDHLPWPDYHGGFVMDKGHGGKASTFADLLSPTRLLFEEHFKNNPLAEPFMVLHEWSDEDPLADMLLATFGALPPIDETAHDYRGLIQLYLRASVHRIASDQPIETIGSDQMSLASFNCIDLKRHYAVQSSWGEAGFYIGDVTDFDDIVTYWNLRAADVPLFFYDPAQADRLDHGRDQWLNRIPRPTNQSWFHGTSIWSRTDRTPDDLAWAGKPLRFNSVSPAFWSEEHIRAPMMIFGTDNVLASVDDHDGRALSISFAIPNSPLRNGSDLDEQQYVVSVDPGIGLLGNEHFTLHLPFLPNLNKFYGHNAIFHRNKARAEPGSLGVIVCGSTHDISIRAIETRQLFEQIFATVSIAASPSPAGLVCNRLIRQMGGIDGCRVFRIGGVRHLIKQYPPEKSFTSSAAKRTILAEGTDHPLSEYNDLYIEPRPVSTRLTNDAVLAHLLRKEVFRPGLKFDCPSCQLDFWISLDDVRTKTQCEYCGHTFHVGPHLRDRDWAYRRSGLFGRNDDQQGAIPVVLTLLRLMHMHDPTSFGMTTATSLVPNGADIRECETDFIFLVNRGQDHRIHLAIGECKNRGPISQDDVQNLLQVARAFPNDRFDVFLIFTKLADFSENELSLIATANDDYIRRVIILTPRELDHWFPYKRAAELFQIDPIIIDLHGMAKATQQIFFENARRDVN